MRWGCTLAPARCLGGETFVRQEVAKLDAAKYQFQLAEQELTRGAGLQPGQRLSSLRLLHPDPNGRCSHAPPKANERRTSHRHHG